MSNQFKPGDWSELKQKALAAADEFGSYDPAEAEIEFMSAISPGVVLALIAENERLQEEAGSSRAHDRLLQQIGSALGLAAGSDLHTDCVPKIYSLFTSIGRTTAEAAQAHVRFSAERDQLRAEVEALRKDAERAAYWKQRAKSAEGHLYAGDFYAAARALHQRTAHASIPWEELSVSQTAKICAATAAVIETVNARRDMRLPHDVATGKGGRADG